MEDNGVELIEQSQTIIDQMAAPVNNCTIQVFAKSYIKEDSGSLKIVCECPETKSYRSLIASIKKIIQKEPIYFDWLKNSILVGLIFKQMIYYLEKRLNNEPFDVKNTLSRIEKAMQGKYSIVESHEVLWKERTQLLIHLLHFKPQEGKTLLQGFPVIKDLKIVQEQIEANKTPIDDMINELDEIDNCTIKEILDGEYKCLAKILERELQRRQNGKVKMCVITDYNLVFLFLQKYEEIRKNIENKARENLTNKK